MTYNYKKKARLNFLRNKSYIQFYNYFILTQILKKNLK